MKEAKEVAQGSITMSNEYNDDILNTDTREDGPFWKTETGTRFGAIHTAVKTRWNLCAILSVSAILLLALIITVSVNNVKVDSKFSAVEKTVANLSVLITHFQQAKETDKQTILREISHLKIKIGATTDQLDSVSEELKGLDQLESLRTSVSELKCALKRLLQNGTADGCCPLDWLSFSSHCYYFSSEGLSWHTARDHCVSHNAELITLKSSEEWAFVTKRSIPLYYWIGLSDENNNKWEWIDGTPLDFIKSQWMPGQPDNWAGHGLGGGEDCAHLHSDGRLNDDHCSRILRYVCKALASSQAS